MEASMVSIAVSIVLAAILTWSWRVLNWVWLRPKKLEMHLRQQGIRGNSYRLLVGDVKEISFMSKQSKSKPIDFSDDISNRVMPFHFRLLKQYGKNFFIWIGPKPRVVIMNPEQIKEVLMRTTDFQKIVPDGITKLLFVGVVTLEGEKWIKHRKIINPAFHQEKLKFMVPAFHQSGSYMINEWETMVVSENGCCELDVWPHLQNMTRDAISRTAFGSSFVEGKRIFHLLGELAELTAYQVFQSVPFPGKSFLPTKAIRRMKEITKDIDVSIMNIVNKREKAMKAGNAAKNDLLGILLESNLREIQRHENNKDVGMSIKDVIEECKLFYFAGQETTSVLLVWTLILLSKHLDWQARAREEVSQVFGNSLPHFDGLNHLKFVTMILYEVLRLYPPAANINRSVPKDTRLGNISLPAGTQISLPVLFVHHDKDLWGDDALDFKPERFSEGISKATKNQTIYFPFGGGPRICIGQNFSLVEAKVSLAMILQRFTFDLSPAYVHTPLSNFTIVPEHGARINIRKHQT
ncbi:secologanin synthase-like [Tripterygium wilfordii]|uniref:Secologanin synthase-like n=1 Tax=Tripterygium wilfordii TaxID=458696 RepID=A0A7J7C9E4_TRIWF|nr:cytochrome P450 72A225-like [Tripterygium wilfordii]KAF5730781.1 secologanin synthase-like [Tripterygium wilfordii]